MEALIGLAVNSTVPFEHLFLDKMPMRFKDLLHLLDALSGLQELIIHDPPYPSLKAYRPVSQELLNRLTVDRSFLPHLAKLELICFAGDGQPAVTREEVDRVIRSKAGGYSRIERIGEKVSCIAPRRWPSTT